MTPVSLKERMKQLQALKSSVQVKTQAALEKEKELENIASNTPEESAAPSELTTQALEDDTTGGNKIQTETDGTNMSPALPVAPPTQEEEINNGPSKTDGEEANMPPALPVAPPIQEEEVKDGPSKTDGGEEFEEVEVEEPVVEEGDDGVEIIVEEVVVEGTTEGVEIVDTEELVVVEDKNEYEKTIETETGPEPPTDEKIFDEYAHGRQGTPRDGLAPMDEKAYPEGTGDLEVVSDSAPFDENSTEVLPVFMALDAEEVKSRDEPLGTSNESQVGVANRASGTTADRRDSTGLPRGDHDKENRRWKLVICFLVCIGICALAALILPFVVDYETLFGDDPTMAPTISPAPTRTPSMEPTMEPTTSPAPSQSPTRSPSTVPTVSPAPSDLPTAKPSKTPTGSPTSAPTKSPTVPTPAPVPPTKAPTPSPTSAPTPPPTDRPVAPTAAPVSSPTSAPTSLRLENFIDIFCVPISGEAAFEDQGSPQFQAARFVAEDDAYSADITDESLLRERYAMATFYYATNGGNWDRCNVDDTSCDTRWLVGDVCGWESITCNESGRVTVINFDGLLPVGLSGFIPPEIYVLRLLEDFTIIDEAVGGSLPELFGTNATNIRQLVIQGTQLAGSIPFAYLENSPIESLLLNSNRIGGTIPFEIGSFQNLMELDLSDNKMTGTLPGGLVRYSSLNTLAVGSNSLEGSIPTGIYAMANLKRLYVNDNTLMDGSLDAAIGAMDSLRGLRVGNTGIGGVLPEELFTLGNLVELDLHGAAFRGLLPWAFSRLGSTLEQLHLQENAFTGTVPVAFGRLTSLTVLNLEGNNLQGSIVTDICQLLTAGVLGELTVDCDEVECSCCTECFR